MEPIFAQKDVVEPIVRAKISSLVSALGGSGAEEDGRYVLGDEALECLRDLKRWINYYDKQRNTLDVVRCLAETNVVEGDLLPILATWLESAPQKGFKSKIAMGCVELLVHLTFPMEADVQTMTVNHHRHIPFLQKAQLGYKRSIIGYDKAKILHTAVRCALPSMAETIGDRSSRDEGIIRIVLYFIRNVIMITPPPSTRDNGDESEVSRSATIGAFQYQDIFPLLLTLSSTMGEDFNTQDVVILEILFHLIKGVDIEKLFMDEAKADSSMGEELVRLRRKEQAMLDSYKVNAPSRHNRFGTMGWMQRGDGKMTTVTGQAAMLDSSRTLAKIDATKKFKPPRRAQKGDNGPLDFDTPTTLNPQANKHLRAFVEDFLDSGFNPLFNHLRKAIDREAERVDLNHPRQFFYLVSWFLEAERQRRKTKKNAKKSKSAVPVEIDSFSLVASVLNQEMFVTLNRAMDSTLENKLWQDLSAAMKCFTQILLTVQDMSESPLEEDQEIAENVLNRIFYEETTHERVATITRTYKDQGFGYLDSTTELAHNYLRILEQYSKQNVDLQVRSRRRTRRKKKAAREAGEDGPDDDIIDESDAEDERRAETTTRERNFDFKKFAAKFLTQGCVDTFVTFTSFYSDLKPHQLKRSHRFFYRVAFKQEMSVMLFRVDIIALLHKMIKGPEGLDPQSSTFKEWEELVKQILKKCTRKIQERPQLIVEMLFSKINSTAHYLEYGYEKQTFSAKPRAAAELEVKGGKEWEEQVAIVVGAMLDRNEADHLQWVKSQLYSAEIERRSWEGANAALLLEQASTIDGEDQIQLSIEAESAQAPSILVKSDTSTRKIAMFKNGHLRLLMNLIGFRRLGQHDDPEGSWMMPSSLSADQLKQSHDLIKKSEHIPPTFDDELEAGDFIRRKSALATSSRKKAVFDDDNGIENDTDEELFPLGGPTEMPRSKKDAMKALKKTRRKRRKGTESGEEGMGDEVLKARAEARREKELEKHRKIKSELYIHGSDEEEDEEKDRAFFAREEEIRQRSKVQIAKMLGEETGTKKKSKKSKSSAVVVDSDDDDVVLSGSRKRQSSVLSDDSDEEPASKRGRSSSTAHDVASGHSEEEATDTPMSSPHTRPSKMKRRKVVSSPARLLSPEVVQMSKMVVDEDDEEDDVPMVRPARMRRAGFIVDSSDEG